MHAPAVSVWASAANTYMTIITDASCFIRLWGPLLTSHTMEGSASMVRTPFRFVQSKGASVDRMTTEGDGAGTWARD